MCFMEQIIILILGTKRAGMVFIVPGKGFRRSIHNLENSYFRTKFEDELSRFQRKFRTGSNKRYRSATNFI